MKKYVHINQKQLDGAKIYSNRWDWVLSLNKELDIMEVGVGAGDYSFHILKSISPKTLTLVDKYQQDDAILANPNRQIRFYKDQHYDFVKKRFEKYKNVKLIKGDSLIVLEDLINTNIKFDMIYIDAFHSYENVSKDINNASKLLKDNGIIAINDYIKYVQDEKYGVILATNEFLDQNKDWHVVGFALEEDMMADIYLSKYPWQDSNLRPTP